MDRELSIGALAKRSGATPPTIRYYEQIGLVRRAERRDGGHRTYGDADLQRLTFIRRCRELGFPIEQVRSLIELLENGGDRSCLDARDLARQNLNVVRTKLDELKALEADLAKLVSDCDAACASGPSPDCVILEDLAQTRQKSCCGPKAA